MTSQQEHRLLRLAAHVAFRYFVAVASVLVALLVTIKLQNLLGETISPLFFAAVMISAWYGGWGPGLVATGLSGYFSAFYFVNPPLHPGFGWDDAIRLIVFLMVAILISSLTSLQKRADAALQRSYETLEIKIAQRTRQLQESNIQLTASEERFRLLVEGVADYAIVMLDSAGHVASWNAGAQRIYGYTQEEAMGKELSDFYIADDVLGKLPSIHVREAVEDGRAEAEGLRIRKDGTRFWANVITTALADETNRPRGFAQVTRDVSELRSLEKEVLDISEREQMRISHDIHDGIGQELTGLALLAQNLQQKLAMQSLAEASEASRIAALINRTLDQTRQLVRGFSPLELGPDGLATALADLASKVQASTHLPCTFQKRGEIQISDAVAAVHLYRIAQGALGNAVRHSKATQFRVTLEMMVGVLKLAIEDNGIGLPLENQRGAGIGIKVMKYRARMIGANLDLHSSPRGTVISCFYNTGNSYAAGQHSEQFERVPAEADDSGRARR